MKSLRRALATTLAAALAATLLSATAVSAETTKEYPTVIVSLGDSLTRARTTDASRGVDANGNPISVGPAGDAIKNSWSTGTGTVVDSHRNRLATATGRPITAVNSALSGSKSSDLLRQARSAVLSDPEYVTILSGANDICGAYTVSAIPTTAVYKQNVRVALAELTAGTSKPDILLASLPSLMKLYDTAKDDPSARYMWASERVCGVMLSNPEDVSAAAQSRRASVEARVQDYNLALQQVCSEFSTCFFDDSAVYATSLTLSDLSVDYFHASVSGQSKVAEATWAVADRKIFSRNGVTPSPVTPTPTVPPVAPTATPTAVPGVNTPPTITGAGDVTVYQNVPFVPAAGVTAEDAEDGDLTTRITTSGKVNTARPGAYPVKHSVVDSAGAKTTVSRTVTVAPNQKPTITGARSITVGQWSQFDPAHGVTAADAEDGALTHELAREGAVDTSKPGRYTVVYSVADSRGAITKTNRVITVVANSRPVISGATDVAIERNSRFDARAGVTATDAEDGTITRRITTAGSVDTAVPGIHLVTYSVKDSRGVVVTVERRVTVGEHEHVNVAPTISGANDVTVHQWARFDARKGVTAADAEDGSITSRIVTSGTVNMSVPGTYPIRYSVKDSDGASTTVTRIVTVAPNSKPVITASKHSVRAGTTVYSPLRHATASDAEDGDITERMTARTTVDTSRVGSYKTTYTVTDSVGGTATKTVAVTVY